jgi:hypothetical protein
MTAIDDLKVRVQNRLEEWKVPVPFFAVVEVLADEFPELSPNLILQLLHDEADEGRIERLRRGSRRRGTFLYLRAVDRRARKVTKDDLQVLRSMR